MLRVNWFIPLGKTLMDFIVVLRSSFVEKSPEKTRLTGFTSVGSGWEVRTNANSKRDRE